MKGNDRESIEKNKFFITETVKDIITNPDIKVGFHCLNRLNSFNRFIKPHKDKNTDECSNVVYKLSCKDCDASYIGQTKRQLKTRIKEHKSNIKLDPNKISVISEHINSFNHSFNWDNIKILDVEHNYFKRLTSEIIHIKEQKTGINLQTDSELLNEEYTTILSKLANS